MRPLALLLLVACALLPAGEAPWTGRIEIVETVAGARASGDQKELETLTSSLQARVLQVRERLKTATPTVARTLTNDLAHLQAELEQVAVERGGTIALGTTRYAIGPQKTLVDGEDARVVIDRAAGVATVTAAGRSESLRVPAPPAARELKDEKKGDPAFGAPTRRGILKVEDDEYRVTLAPSLPNPYALGLLPATSKDALTVALAALPGLPVVVETRHGDKVRRWTVTACAGEAVDDADW